MQQFSLEYFYCFLFSKVTSLTRGQWSEAAPLWIPPSSVRGEKGEVGVGGVVRVAGSRLSVITTVRFKSLVKLLLIYLFFIFFPSHDASLWRPGLRVAQHASSASSVIRCLFLHMTGGAPGWLGRWQRGPLNGSFVMMCRRGPGGWWVEILLFNLPLKIPFC